MAGKAFEVSFKLGGSLASSFGSAFSTATTKVDKLKDKSKELKRELRQLEKSHKSGKLSVDQYTRSEEKLTRALDKNLRQQRSLINSEKRLSAIRSKATSIKNSTAAKVAMVGTPAMAGAAVGGVAISSINKAMNFESQLSAIQAVTGITAKEMESVRKVSLEQGAATKYSALEAAQGFEELLKAGISLDTALGDGLSSALNLATAGNLELAESAEILADGMNGFKKDGNSAADVANILAGAANASSTGVREMKYGISAVGPVADGLGVSFKDVNATLALFSNNALKGSDAGTSLKTFLANIVPKTKKAREAFHDFGLMTKDGKNIFFDTNGELKEMSEVAGILQKSFKDLNAEQRSDIFYDLFGSDAIRAANILFKEGSEGINKMYDEMSKVTALDVAKNKMDNAAGAVEQLSGALETIQIISAEAFNPLIKLTALNLAEYFENNTDKFERFGKRLSNSVGDILSPFNAKRPEYDHQRAKLDPEYQQEYNKELAEFNKYSNMDFGDRVIESLDIMTEKVENWVNGSGGQAFERIFTKLAEISMNAYANTLKATATGAWENLKEGNLSAAGGLGALAWMMGGGALVKGGFGVGKKVTTKAKDVITKKKGKKGSSKDDGSASSLVTTDKSDKKDNKKSKKAKKDKSNEDKKEKSSKKKEKSKSTKSSKKSKGFFEGLLGKTTKGLEKAGGAVKKAGKTAVSTVGKTATKVVGKAAVPLALVTGAIGIAGAKDKKKAIAKTAGSAAGGYGGTATGAAIGTAIFPGVGTAIGGLLGGIAGGLIGEKAGSTAIDAVRGSKVQAKSIEPTSQPTASSNASIGALDQQTNVLKQNLQTLTSYVGQASGWLASMYPIQASAQKVVFNADILTSYLGQASGWLASLFPFQEAAQKTTGNMNILTSYVGQASGWVVAGTYGIKSSGETVQTALNNLATKINNLKPSIPTASDTSVAGPKPKKKYARGGFASSPHIGLFGEAGEEAFIPINNSSRSLALWEETGRKLGATYGNTNVNVNSASNGTPEIHLNYSPTIYANDANGVAEQLHSSRNSFMDQLKEVVRKEKRTAYD